MRESGKTWGFKRRLQNWLSKKQQRLFFIEETRVFEPSKELVENSNVMAWMKKKGFKTEREMRAWTGQNYLQFWSAGPMLTGSSPTLRSSTGSPYAKWFVGGKINVAYNAVDRHAAGTRRTRWPLHICPSP